jgi:hypothetical protein
LDTLDISENISINEENNLYGYNSNLNDSLSLKNVNKTIFPDIFLKYSQNSGNFTLKSQFYQSDDILNQKYSNSLNSLESLDSNYNQNNYISDLNMFSFNTDVNPVDLYNYGGYINDSVDNYGFTSFNDELLDNISYADNENLNNNLSYNNFEYNHDSIVKNYDIAYSFKSNNQYRKILDQENKIYNRNISNNLKIIRLLFGKYFNYESKNGFTISDEILNSIAENKVVWLTSIFKKPE